MAKPQAGSKILRVGIIQSGKIIEERLLRKREAVTIGQSPKNTFYVPISKLPRTLTLFEVRSDRIFLCFGEGMRGRVSYGDKVHSLPDLKTHQAVVKKGASFMLPLDEKSRGKIVLGDITLLFQFVPPPPVVPKPQLPASAKGGLGFAIMQESAFLFALIASLVIQGGFLAMSIIFETPPDQRPKRNVLLQSLKVDVEFEEPEDEVLDDTVEMEEEGNAEELEPEPPPMAEPPKEPTPQPKPPERVVRPQPRPKAATPKPVSRQLRRQKLRETTILKHITSGGPGGTAGPDALRAGHAGQLADAFKPVGPISVGGPGDVAGFRGGPKLEGEPGAGARVAGLGKGERPGGRRLKTGRVKTTAKRSERRVKLRIGLRGGRKSGGLGRLDGAAVTKVFRRRSSAFRACYESRLKVNPNLSGKVVIKFTIGSAGRITNISVSSNSTGDSTVGSCIIGKVRRWRFSPPENGSVTFTYPIVLSKG